MENVQNNDSTITCGTCENFNNTAGDKFSILSKAVNLKIIRTNKNFHLTSNGDLANIHDP